MAENLILSEITISADEWVWDDQFGYTATIEKKFSFTADEAYRIVCNGTPNEASVAHDISELVGFDMVAVGNMGVLGLPANTGKYILGDGGTYNMFLLTSLPQSNPPGEYKFSVYHVTEDVPEEPETPEEPDPPEGIVLKDRNGKDVAYYGIETVTFDTTTEGKQQVFTKGVVAPKMEIPVTFADGDMLITADKNTLIKELVLQKPDTAIPENIRKDVNMCGLTGTFIGDTEERTVDLNMADGDQIIVPSALGKVLSWVTVKKPEALVPENIAEGIDIAGIIGTLAAGGANVKIAYGTFTGNDSNVVVTHNLGVAPDVVVTWTTSVPTNTATSIIRIAIGFSQAMTDALGALGSNVAGLTMSTKKSGSYQTGNLSDHAKVNTIEKPTPSNSFHDATETTVTVGYYQPSVGVWQTGANFEYKWIAIGGLAE